MTPTHEPHEPEPDDLSPEALAEADTWLTRQHHDTGTDLTNTLDLDTGLGEILLAGHHRDTGTDLTNTLDLTAGLAAILPTTTPTTPPPTRFTDLLDRLSATPTTRLTHRHLLRALATDIFHHATSANARPTRTRDLDLVRARTLALDLVFDRGHTRASNLDRARDHAIDLARDLNRALDLALTRALDRGHTLDRDLDLDHQRDVEAQILALAGQLCTAVCEAVVRSGVGQLVRAINREPIVDTSWLDMATIDAHTADRLHDLTDDFVTADLRQVNVTNLDLIGVQWSRSTTKWPPADEEWILTASEPGPGGIYTIRAASAGDGLTTAPTPGPISV
ncbi:hypothetical protein ACTG9Q_24615 [Actinokineospora sp. 24-640]